MVHIRMRSDVFITSSFFLSAPPAFADNAILRTSNVGSDLNPIAEICVFLIELRVFLYICFQ